MLARLKRMLCAHRSTNILVHTLSSLVFPGDIYYHPLPHSGCLSGSECQGLRYLSSLAPRACLEDARAWNLTRLQEVFVGTSGTLPCQRPVANRRSGETDEWIGLSGTGLQPEAPTSLTIPTAAYGSACGSQPPLLCLSVPSSAHQDCSVCLHFTY